MQAVSNLTNPSAYKRVLNDRELSIRLGVARTTLQKWRQQSYGPAFLKLSSRVVYPLDAVEAFERDNMRKSTSERA
jgi:hypothetical protein